MQLTRYLVVFGNEPRLCREAFAAAVRELRPDIDSIAIAPGDVETALRMHRPCLLVCSRVTEAIKASGVDWIMIPPEGGQPIEIDCGGEQDARSEITLVDLLAFIDRAVAHAAQVA